MIFKFPCKHPSDHPSIFLHLSVSISAKPCFRQSRGHRLKLLATWNDAMSSCKPKSIFFCTLAVFSCAAWTLVSIFWSVSMYQLFKLSSSNRSCGCQPWSYQNKIRPRPNILRACNHRERVRNVSTTATSSVGPVLYSPRTLSHHPHPPNPQQHVNYVTHLAGTLRHPTPKFNSWTLIFTTFIFQICNFSKGSWMAHLKISNPSKGGASAAWSIVQSPCLDRIAGPAFFQYKPCVNNLIFRGFVRLRKDRYQWCNQNLV